ncbi:LytTR family DNA-binding domain-containing protein [Cesiribacter sp. SM1]|uniref:LytR/AlgR family response regulator transcription factor n=1 Tax=Cesiribacter sp. SM1 TaxID=2861196 RepID=UPI001CD2ED71|nr:LytTR family DNA-binding domain-containing protein [Cesiribacter sp. SM1]
MNLKTIIIDDEVHARNILAHYISRLQGFELIASYDNCISCFEAHDLDQVDLILLDINLPTISGLQFARTLARYKAEVIFTTAYSEHALQGYEHNIVDYLLKPIAFDRFSKAMEKAAQLIMLKKGRGTETKLTETVAQAQPDRPKNDFLFIKADYKIMKVCFDDIIFIEGFQEYVRIHLVKGKPIITLQSLKKIVEVLPTEQFFRVHRSYIININRLEYVQQKIVSIGGKELKIGKNYWEDFSSYLSSHGIF